MALASVLSGMTLLGLHFAPQLKFSTPTKKHRDWRRNMLERSEIKALNK
jgi:hypothetical protein